MLFFSGFFNDQIFNNQFSKLKFQIIINHQIQQSRRDDRPCNPGIHSRENVMHPKKSRRDDQHCRIKNPNHQHIKILNLRF